MKRCSLKEIPHLYFHKNILPYVLTNELAFVKILTVPNAFLFSRKTQQNFDKDKTWVVTKYVLCPFAIRSNDD